MNNYTPSGCPRVNGFSRQEQVCSNICAVATSTALPLASEHHSKGLSRSTSPLASCLPSNGRSPLDHRWQIKVGAKHMNHNVALMISCFPFSATDCPHERSKTTK